MALRSPFVTGANRGVGKGIAIALGSAGATVIMPTITLPLPRVQEIGGTQLGRARLARSARHEGVTMGCAYRTVM